MKLFKHESYDKERVKELMFLSMMLGSTITMFCIWLNETFVHHLLFG